jgi:hypothetical protein
MNESLQRPSRKMNKRYLAESIARRLSRSAALAVAVTVAGLLVGCSAGSSSGAAGVAPNGAATSPTASAAATSAQSQQPPTSAPATSAPATASTATTSPAPVSTVGNGTQLGAYAFQLTNGYSAPLGPTAPTQAEMASGASCDVQYNGAIYSCNQEKIISLPNGSTPSYSACTTGTLFVSGVNATQGNVFCIIETNGSVAGITVTAAGSSPNYYVSLKVTVWKYVS